MATKCRQAEQARCLTDEGLSEGRINDDDIVAPHEQPDYFAELSSDDPDDEPVDPRRREIMEVMAEEISRGRVNMPDGCYHHRDDTYLLEHPL